ncbi:MAG TPA: hypothetical protein DEO84_12140 [candidate division Zixibacteria bacterium]|nr:hypothetical protein [candidate division Zixibacteria bacterium]
MWNVSKSLGRKDLSVSNNTNIKKCVRKDHNLIIINISRLAKRLTFLIVSHRHNKTSSILKGLHNRYELKLQAVAHCYILGNNLTVPIMQASILTLSSCIVTLYIIMGLPYELALSNSANILFISAYILPLYVLKEFCAGVVRFGHPEPPRMTRGIPLLHSRAFL